MFLAQSVIPSRQGSSARKNSMPHSYSVKRYPVNNSVLHGGWWLYPQEYQHTCSPASACVFFNRSRFRHTGDISSLFSTNCSLFRNVSGFAQLGPKERCGANVLTKKTTCVFLNDLWCRHALLHRTLAYMHTCKHVVAKLFPHHCTVCCTRRCHLPLVHAPVSVFRTSTGSLTRPFRMWFLA